MGQIIRLDVHNNRRYIDARAEVHLQEAGPHRGTICYPLDQFMVFGYESGAPENEILTYKGAADIRVEALKALLSSFDASRMTDAEKDCVQRSVECLKKAFQEFVVRTQVW